MALGHLNPSIVAQHYQHSARTVRRCREMGRAVMLNRSIPQKLYRRQEIKRMPVVASAQDMASAGDTLDAQSIEYEYQYTYSALPQGNHVTVNSHGTICFRYPLVVYEWIAGAKTYLTQAICESGK